MTTRGALIHLYAWVMHHSLTLQRDECTNFQEFTTDSKAFVSLKQYVCKGGKPALFIWNSERDGKRHPSIRRVARMQSVFLGNIGHWKHYVWVWKAKNRILYVYNRYHERDWLSDSGRCSMTSNQILREWWTGFGEFAPEYYTVVYWEWNFHLGPSHRQDQNVQVSWM